MIADSDSESNQIDENSFRDGLHYMARIIVRRFKRKDTIS